MCSFSKGLSHFGVLSILAEWLKAVLALTLPLLFFSGSIIPIFLHNTTKEIDRWRQTTLWKGHRIRETNTATQTPSINLRRVPGQWKFDSMGLQGKRHTPMQLTRYMSHQSSNGGRLTTILDICPLSPSNCVSTSSAFPFSCLFF